MSASVMATSEKGTEGAWVLAPKPPGAGTAGKSDSAPSLMAAKCYQAKALLQGLLTVPVIGPH